MSPPVSIGHERFWQGVALNLHRYVSGKKTMREAILFVLNVGIALRVGVEVSCVYDMTAC